MGIGITFLSQPIALILVEEVDPFLWKILSIFVKPNFRNIGIGRELLKSIEVELKKRGCKFLEVEYSERLNSRDSFEKVLYIMKWDPPKVSALIAEISLESLKSTHFFNIDYKITKDYEIFNWKSSLTLKDREALSKNLWYPKFLDPLEGEDHTEPFTSLGVRYRDDIIGWIINVRYEIQGREILSYGKYFMKEEFRNRAIGAITLIKSIKNHSKYLNSALGFMKVNLDNKERLNFFNNYLRAHSSYIGNMKRSFRIL